MAAKQNGTPRWVRAFQRHSKWTDAANTVLKTMANAREGGPFSKVLAGVSAFGTVLDTMYPSESAWQILRMRGYIDTNYCIGGFLSDLLLRSGLPMTVLPAGLIAQVIIWETEQGGIASVYSGGKYQDGPYIMNGDQDYFIGVIREVVWGKGSDLMLSAVPDMSASGWRGAGKFRLSPMNTPGPYIGKRQPQWFADRLAKYGDECRTILLRGPTGIGKSVLARHVANLVGKKDTRTLKIAASVLKNCRFDEVLAFITFFQPTVLLLDDLSLDDKRNTENFLTLLEALRAPNSLVMATMMTPTDRNKEPEIGDWHFEGMRPGRIDETWTFYLPDEDERDEILNLHLDLFETKRPKKAVWKKILEATDGLSGAYLMEVARRIAVHGLKGWEAEVENVRRTAPKPGEEGSSEIDVEGLLKAIKKLTPKQVKNMDVDGLAVLFKEATSGGDEGPVADEGVTPR